MFTTVGARRIQNHTQQALCKYVDSCMEIKICVVGPLFIPTASASFVKDAYLHRTHQVTHCFFDSLLSSSGIDPFESVRYRHNVSAVQLNFTELGQTAHIENYIY